jgi:hypothetical protein
MSTHVVHASAFAVLVPEPDVVIAQPVPQVIVAVVLEPVPTVSNVGDPPVESAEHAQVVPPVDLGICPAVQKLSAAKSVKSASSVWTAKQPSAAPEASTPRGAVPAAQFAPLATSAVAVATVVGTFAVSCSPNLIQV